MSNVSDVQLLIGDPDGALFTEEQIQTFLTMTVSESGTESVYKAAALACRSLAASGVLLSKAESIGGYKLDRKSLSQNYLALAESFEEKATSAPACGIAEFSWTPDNAVDIAVNDAIRDDI